MKTLALTLVLITNAHAYNDGLELGYDDDYPVHRYPTVEDNLNRPREYVMPSIPVMPSMITNPRNEGSTYFGPDQWCRSDGSNTFCFRR